jgi:hypothetical protein
MEETLNEILENERDLAMSLPKRLRVLRTFVFWFSSLSWLVLIFFYPLLSLFFTLFGASAALWQASRICAHTDKLYKLVVVYLFFAFASSPDFLYRVFLLFFAGRTMYTNYPLEEEKEIYGEVRRVVTVPRTRDVIIYKGNRYSVNHKFLWDLEAGPDPAMQDARIRVLYFEDDPKVREKLKAIIEGMSERDVLKHVKVNRMSLRDNLNTTDTVFTFDGLFDRDVQ